MKTSPFIKSVLFTALALCASRVMSDDDQGGNDDRGNNRRFKELPTQAQLVTALKSVVDVGGTNNAGFGLNMWATIVNRDGDVAAVAFSGKDRGDQWPGSRVISAQKANTANAFSLPGLALSTANLYTAVQPGGSLY